MWKVIIVDEATLWDIVEKLKAGKLARLEERLAAAKAEMVEE